MDFWFDMDDPMCSQDNNATNNSQTSLYTKMADISLDEVFSQQIVAPLVENKTNDIDEHDEWIADVKQCDTSAEKVDTSTQNADISAPTINKEHTQESYIKINDQASSYPSKRVKSMSQPTARITQTSSHSINSTSYRPSTSNPIDGLIIRLGILTDILDIFKSFTTDELKALALHFHRNARVSIPKRDLCRIVADANKERTKHHNNVSISSSTSSKVGYQPKVKSVADYHEKRSISFQATAHFDPDPSHWSTCSNSKKLSIELDDVNTVHANTASAWIPCSEEMDKLLNFGDVNFMTVDAIKCFLARNKAADRQPRSAAKAEATTSIAEAMDVFRKRLHHHGIGQDTPQGMDLPRRLSRYVIVNDTSSTSSSDSLSDSIFADSDGTIATIPSSDTTGSQDMHMSEMLSLPVSIPDEMIILNPASQMDAISENNERLSPILTEI